MKGTPGIPTELHTTEEKVCANCCKKLEVSSATQTATELLGRLPSRPNEVFEDEVETSYPKEKSYDPEPVSLEILVLKPRAPFARKRLDLSIYTFEEPDDEHIIEEARSTLTEDATCEEEYKDDKKFVRTKF